MFALWFHKVSVTFGFMFVDLTGISWSEHCFGLKSGKTVSLKGYSSVLGLILISHSDHEQEKLLTTQYSLMMEVENTSWFAVTGK